MTKTELLSTVKIVVLSLVLVLGISYVSAWTAPTGTPPDNNVAAPINTSLVTQVKAGALGVSGYFTAYSGMSANGKLINNVATPIAGTDAVNKDYVDAQTSGGGSIFSHCGVASVSNTTAPSAPSSQLIMVCVKPNGNVCRTGNLMSPQEGGFLRC